MLKPTLLTATLTLTMAANAQFGGLPKPQIDIPIPGLDNLLKGEPPLSTTIKDSKIWGWPNFSTLELSNPITLTSEDRDENQLYPVKPGHYKLTIKSFCGKGYTYGPTGGLGYVPGPWKGSRSEFLQRLLRAYNSKPEVEQRDVQLLIWATLARVKPQDMNEGAKRALVQLMGNDGGKLLAEGAADYFTGKVADELFKKASKELRPFLEYDNKIRGLNRDINATYDQFERLSVLESPKNLKIDIPRGVWNLSPRGYLIRYQPLGYSKTEIEVIVPRIAEIIRDDSKRISQMKWSDGFSISIGYGEKPAQDIPGEPNLKMHAVSQVSISIPGRPEPILSAKEDFVLTGVPKPKSHRIALAPTLLLRLHSPLPMQLWGERVERARDLHDRIETYEEWYDRMQRIERGEQPEDDLFDSNSVSDLIGSIFGGTDDRLEQIGDTHGRLAEHLAHATNVIAGLGNDGSIDPSQDVIVPGAGGSQLILGSSNSF